MPRLNSISTTSLFLSSRPAKIADLKLVLLGESSVGKSSILQRFQNDTFTEGKASTIGAAFISKKILRENEQDDTTSLVNMQIWDTAGQERFHNLTPLYYRNANVALVVFDMTDRASFKKAEYWMNELKTYIEESEDRHMKVILIGNKKDLLEGGESAFTADIEAFIDSHRPAVDSWFQTSAKEGAGVSELFDYIIDNVDESLFRQYEDEQEHKKKKGLVDLRFANTESSSCQC